MKRTAPMTLSRGNLVARALWGVAAIMLFRPTPRPAHRWRCFLLRRFGARIGQGCRVYQTARIWAPWNLVMQDGACLGDGVDCYSVARIELGRNAVVSQYSFLCTASHDTRQRSLPMIAAPIHIRADAWVTADVFVGPGVTIGEGTVITVRSTVTRDVPPWKIARGNPAVPVRDRVFEGRQTGSRPAEGGPGGAPVP